MRLTGRAAPYCTWSLQRTTCRSSSILFARICPHYFALTAVQVTSKAVDVNAIDQMKRSALHWAAVLGHHEFVALLLQHGAKAKLADDTGATALHYAVRQRISVGVHQPAAGAK